MLAIKVLGPGCANCKRVEQIVRKIVSDMSLEAEIIKVTDYPEIMKYNIMSTPGLVIMKNWFRLDESQARQKSLLS